MSVEFPERPLVSHYNLEGLLGVRTIGAKQTEINYQQLMKQLSGPHTVGDVIRGIGRAAEVSTSKIAALVVSLYL